MLINHQVNWLLQINSNNDTLEMEGNNDSEMWAISFKKTDILIIMKKNIVKQTLIRIFHLITA